MGLQVKTTNVLLKDGETFNPVEETITTSSRLLRRIVECELAFSGRIQDYNRGSRSLKIITRVMGNLDTLTIQDESTNSKAFDLFMDFLDLYIDGFKANDLDDETVKQIFSDPRVGGMWLRMTGGHLNKAMRAFLEVNGVDQESIKDSKGLYFALECVLDGYSPEDIAELLVA